MSQAEENIYRIASLEKEVAELRGKFQRLKSWLRVNNSGIWQDWKKLTEEK